MAEFPALPLYTDAYIGDTQHLTNEEHGVYLRLLMFAWRTADCSLPDDDKRLALMVGVTAKKWASLKPVVMSFWSLLDGRWKQKKLTAQREFVARNREQKRAAGIASSNAKALKNNDRAPAAVAQPSPTAGATELPTEQQQPISIPIEEDKSSSILSETSSDIAAKPRAKMDYPVAFEAFWKSYPVTPNMSKKEAFDAWKKLSTEERDKCAQGVPGYIAFLKSKPDLETIHACRFISKRRFEGFLSTVSHGSDESWLKRLAQARRVRRWRTAEWGPVPGAPGCRVPDNLIEAGDGDGWAELEVAA